VKRSFVELDQRSWRWRRERRVMEVEKETETLLGERAKRET